MTEGVLFTTRDGAIAPAKGRTSTDFGTVVAVLHNERRRAGSFPERIDVQELVLQPGQWVLAIVDPYQHLNSGDAIVREVSCDYPGRARVEPSVSVHDAGDDPLTRPPRPAPGR